MYSVLDTLSEYTYFYVSTNITSYTFAACFQNRRKPLVYPWEAIIFDIFLFSILIKNENYKRIQQ